MILAYGAWSALEPVNNELVHRKDGVFYSHRHRTVLGTSQLTEVLHLAVYLRPS